MRKTTLLLVVLVLVLSASRQLSSNTFNKAALMNSDNLIRESCGMTWTYLDTSNTSYGVDEAILNLYAPSPYGIPLCAIEEYETDEDDDLAWTCDVQYTDAGYYFRLEKLHDGDGGGYIRAKAVLLSFDYFNIYGGAYFWVYNDYIQYQWTNSDLVWKLDGENARLNFAYIPNNVAPVTTINRYYTNKDDDFNFYTAMEWGNQSANLFLDASDGNSGSYISGVTYLIEPRDNNGYRGYIDENGLLIQGNQNELYNPYTIYRQPYFDDANQLMLTSLFAYRPNDMDFSVAAEPERYDPDYNLADDGYLAPGTRVNSHYGGSDSLFGFETVLLQTQPACGW